MHEEVEQFLTEIQRSQSLLEQLTTLDSRILQLRQEIEELWRFEATEYWAGS